MHSQMYVLTLTASILYYRFETEEKKHVSFPSTHGLRALFITDWNFHRIVLNIHSVSFSKFYSRHNLHSHSIFFGPAYTRTLSEFQWERRKLFVDHVMLRHMGDQVVFPEDSPQSSTLHEIACVGSSLAVSWAGRSVMRNRISPLGNIYGSWAWEGRTGEEISGSWLFHQQWGEVISKRRPIKPLYLHSGWTRQTDFLCRCQYQLQLKRNWTLYQNC